MCMVGKYIDPFTDFGFKRIFGNEKHKNLLISFLNDLLDIENPIVDLEYKNLEKLGINITDRKAVLDVYCKDSKDNRFIVELQRAKQTFFKDRSLYYTSFVIQEQAEKGDWNYQLDPIYFVGILEFSLDKEIKKEQEKNKKYLTKVKLCDVEENKVFYDKLTYYYIEIPKFTKDEKELKNHLEYWLYFMKNAAKLDNIPKKLEEDKEIKEAFDVASFLALSEDEKFAYQIDMKMRNDYKNTLDTALQEGIKEGLQKGIKEGLQKGKEEGLKQGLEKGLQKGKEEGLKQGLEKGLQKGKEEGERQAKIEIAKNLLDVLDNETISQKTGLSIKEIENLRIKK